ncbi:MAG TPA: RDD family protein, partial [Thermoanaerobaculia bacterium]|nr:RDD family protein [Thermoanaerobaculia bacterium]
APAEPVASRRDRLLAGLADLLVHAAVGVTAAVGALLLGARPEPADWPPFALFLLSFSFLYAVVPLAFWGQTLGMAWAGLRAVNADGQQLGFGQTALRWLGGLLTAAALGLPLLPARRRSLTDWMSGSVTLRRR